MCQADQYGRPLRSWRARQIWVLDIDDATDELNARWTNKKLLVHEEDIVSAIPSVPIGRDSLLRENPVCCPVRSFKGEWETPAIMALSPSLFRLRHFRRLWRKVKRRRNQKQVNSKSVRPRE